MSSWFSKTAMNVFKPNLTAPPQPFVLACPQCGESLQGLRQPDFQSVVCKVCRTANFILPRDVYPATNAEPPKEKTRKSSSAVLMDDDVVPISEEEFEEILSEKDAGPAKKKTPPVTGGETLPTLSELRQRIRNAEKPRQAQLATAVPQKTSPIEGLGTSLGELGRETHQQIVRFWTPFRILAVAVTVVISVTAIWTWRQSALAQAVRVAKEESALGLEAVAQNEWTRARGHLQLAAAALNRLGRTDPESQTVRQYARETEAQFRLCDLSIQELLGKAQENWENQKEKKKVRNHLARTYEGDWMLFEGTVRDVTEKKARRKEYQLRVPIGTGGTGEALVRMNFPILEKVIDPGSQRDLIVAGAIEDVEFTESGKWIITLNADSGFLWTHRDAYEATGLEFNPARTRDAVESQLHNQAQAMGVPE